ncbi:MAG: carbohydrate kinase family protein [Anaerolineales bacterium]|nr:carbohydrate kinase family protein [Anaerolineales bacterium]
MGIRYVLAGRLHRDFLLPFNARPLLDVPGGNLLYAATGLSLWDKALGLLARVGEDYPRQWLDRFVRYGWDIQGIKIVPERLDLRYFQALLDPYTVQKTNPVSHFVRLGMTFPKALLGYTPPVEQSDDLKTVHPASPRPGDIPPTYLDANAAHICPLDFMSANRLVAAFQQAKLTTLTLDPLSSWMLPEAWDEVRGLVHGLTAFLPSEEEARSLFRNRSTDLWEIAEALASFGCDFVIIKCGAQGQLLYDASTQKRWHIPAYPARLADPTGAGDAFCGGFLAGYLKTFDPLRAVLHGNISASLAIEGSGALYALDTLPRLAQARLESLAGLVRQE